VKPETELKRRDLFRLGAAKATEIAATVVSEKLALRERNWIRPPFAIDEATFVSACTKCDKCIKACPHQVLFRLPDDTPAMDLINRGCRMCDEWPCVDACETGALVLPVDNTEQHLSVPRLARIAINEQTCLPYLGPECGACQGTCPVPGALTWRDGIKPVIEEELCTGCAMCREACIVDPKAIDVSLLPDEPTGNDIT
jgi:ferredoxin-type protein NapG